MRLFSIALMVSLAPVGSSCLWDRDTLQAEAKGKLDLVDAITGRFPQNSAAFYRARLRRVEQEIEANPGLLELYDDAGVACDRMNRSADGIEWMNRKRERLDVVDPDRTKRPEAWYRYFANLGTFQFHAWSRAGANPDDAALAEEGIRSIEEALKINPESHFGRERVQLAAMKWLLAFKRGKLDNGKPVPRLSEYISQEADAGRDRNATIRGLAGLVLLGSGWESADLFEALAQTLSESKDSHLGYLALLRCEEMLRMGVQPIHPSIEEEFRANGRLALRGWQPNDSQIAMMQANYDELREAAMKFKRVRDGFMNPRMRQGKHPDTDPDFWKGFQEPPRPELAGLPFWSGVFGSMNNLLLAIGGVAALIALVMILAKRKQAPLPTSEGSSARLG